MKSLTKQYATGVITKGGLEISIRSIVPKDTPLLRELFKTLSPRTIYLRFFGASTALSEEGVTKVIRMHHSNDIFLLATQKVDGREKALGVFSILSDPTGKTGEFAMLIGDPWQGKGIGAKLFQQGLHLARERGVEMIWGMCLAENRNALALARHMGFACSWDFEENAYRLKMDLIHSKSWSAETDGQRKQYGKVHQRNKAAFRNPLFSKQSNGS